MMHTALIVSIVSLLGWLLLNLRSLDGIVSRYGAAGTAKIALAWVAIIAAVAWLVTVFRP